MQDLLIVDSSVSGITLNSGYFRRPKLVLDCLFEKGFMGFQVILGDVSGASPVISGAFQKGFRVNLGRFEEFHGSFRGSKLGHSDYPSMIL